MRIGIDLFALVPGVGRGGGFQRYTTSLVSALAARDDEHEYVLFVNARAAELFPRTARVRHRVVPLPPNREVWPLRLLWLHAWLPLEAKRQRLDLVHFPMDVASVAPGVPFVLTVNDLISDVFYPARYPGTVSRSKALYLFRTKRRAARRASAVVCPSNATADQVARHYGVRRDRITVVPYAPADQFFAAGAEPRANAPSGRPSVLTVVSLSPHKNLETLLRAFALARERFSLPHELRIIGMHGTGAERLERHLAATSDSAVRYLGFVDEAALVRAYREASLLVFVPLVEGFGLPPLEAMAAGTPVIASDCSSLPEVCGDAALLVPPEDPAAIADAIGRVLTDPSLQRRLSEAGRVRARSFSWARVAERMTVVYEAVGSRQ